MKYVTLTVFLIAHSFLVSAGDLERYMLEYSTANQSDFNREKEIIESTRMEKLIRGLDRFYTDSSGYIRQKAYYLTYKKGMHPETKSGIRAVHKLLEGCSDQDKGIAGQNISYLQQFSKNDFDDKAVEEIGKLVENRKTAHYKKLVLLAGFAGAGQETLYQKFLDKETPQEDKSYIAFALARMGGQEAISYCLKILRKRKASDAVVNYLVPLAIYTRQKEIIRFCEEIIFLDKKLCHSPNPDYSGKILCGYRVLELLAPVIEGFPIKVDEAGSISGISYEGALKIARQWLKNNPDYKLKTEFF
jgi:hypothetical protein